MPFYVYKACEKGCEYCENTFEVWQNLRDKPLEKCPKCGASVRRVIQPVGIGVGWTKNLLSDKNLKEKGFTKLVNEGNGKFTKVV